MLARTRARQTMPGVQPLGGVVADAALRAWGLRHVFGWMGVRPAGQPNIRGMFDQGYKASRGG